LLQQKLPKEAQEPNIQNRIRSLGLLMLFVLIARRSSEQLDETGVHQRPNDRTSAKPRRGVKGAVAAVLRTGLPSIVVVLTGVAVFAIITDRPSPKARINSPRELISSAVAIGTVNPDDFGGATWLDEPALVFQSTKDGTWKGAFAASIAPAERHVLGTFVVVLPPGTEVQTPRPGQFGYTSDFSVDYLSRLTVVHIGLNSRAPQDPSASFGNARAIRFRFTLPYSLGNRMGHGKQRFIVVYSSMPGYSVRDFVPLKPLIRGPEAPEADRKAALRHDSIPARIGLTYNVRDEELSEISPDPTGGLPSSIFWRVDAATPGIVLQGTIEDRDIRWWLERAPDFLFAVFGFMLGAWGPWLRTFGR
jgi:hypothetical protein